MDRIVNEEAATNWQSQGSTGGNAGLLLRHNLCRSMGDGGFFGAMVGVGETFIPAFALAVGMGETRAGMVASIPVAVGGIIQLASLRVLNSVGSYQRWIVMCASMQALSFVGLITVALTGHMSFLPLLLIASVYWASGLASGPAWNTWMESIVPPVLRAKYFAKRSRIQQMTTFGGLMIGGILLQLANRDGWTLDGFLLLFVVAALFRLASATCLATHRQPPCFEATTLTQGPSAQASGGSGAKLLLYLVVVQLFVQISGPYFAPYMLKVLQMSYLEFVVLLAIAFLFRIGSLSLWSYVAKRFGASTLMWIGAVALVPITWPWILSQNLAWLAVAQAISGMAWAAYELGFFLLFFETLPRASRVKMLTFYNLGNSLALLGGAVIGAVVLYALKYQTSAYLVLFGTSSMGRLLAIGLLFRVSLQPVAFRSLAIRVLGIRPATAALDVPILSSIEDK